MRSPSSLPMIVNEGLDWAGFGDSPLGAPGADFLPHQASVTVGELVGVTADDTVPGPGTNPKT